MDLCDSHSLRLICFIELRGGREAGETVTYKLLIGKYAHETNQTEVKE